MEASCCSRDCNSSVPRVSTVLKKKKKTTTTTECSNIPEVRFHLCWSLPNEVPHEDSKRHTRSNKHRTCNIFSARASCGQREKEGTEAASDARERARRAVEQELAATLNSSSAHAEALAAELEAPLPPCDSSWVCKGILADGCGTSSVFWNT